MLPFDSPFQPARLSSPATFPLSLNGQPRHAVSTFPNTTLRYYSIRLTAKKPLTASPESTSRTPATAADVPSVPPPLNIPPSRARRQLAARLAAKKAEAEDGEDPDPDAADAAALAASEHLPHEPAESDTDLAPAASHEIERLSSGLEGLQITGLRNDTGLRRGIGARLEGLMREDDDELSLSEGSEDDVLSSLGVEEGEGEGGLVRRPSTREARVRRPLSDSDEEGRSPFDDPEGEGEGEGDSSEEELVEMRTRRVS